MTAVVTSPPNNVDAVIQDGPHAGYTYPWSADRTCLVVEGIKAINTYKASGEVDAEGRIVLVHKGTLARWREGGAEQKKGTP